ncbi:RNA polymerase sigma factor [Tuwongella immobilis]|uniref:RNA polymerase sigma factor 70 region 4 type 2 domain-containing protein n=1 Tax=Tuwongella immobilis TaxID=692036 RepID=A0A6C2YM47_9BACT|nr:RNA polymerase sigma factor [Tuwongella immobilis]VIP02506.1 rna polymerase subunit sigma-24 : Sigma-70 family RNA polymerase sigma factor OS=Firmicutes bacterium CAG:103 GN=BN455_00512 PE=4 SV=1: Sigma70_r2: Sigma70_r4_2 [Tuwongella immobilis]VTS01606.1 rna polymerase subunit sigma-24 : Sigma-70 family RNA polymerase sigma factor OS=Firmicutes bacterium CAG:103 GN=BN455_00512 PE=4 SV=1: Sigma70_r2: Sigma70_r4_2 [Tuwongella immobilis]
MPGAPDPNPLDAWVLATSARALGYARSLLGGNWHQAEDIVQDCYCRVLRHADEYNLPQDGMKILLRAITNACINARTRRRPWLSLFRQQDDDQTAIEPADPRPEPVEQRLMQQELVEQIAAGMALLPPIQRAALQLKADGHSQAEIAEILDVSAGNVGVLIHRARKTLGDFLAPYLDPEVSS